MSLPCPAPIAVDLTLNSASGAPIDSATVTVTGSVQGSMVCPTRCLITGDGGTYVINVTAPGFNPVERTVKVTGEIPKCGCGSPDTQNVTIALTPSA